MNLNALYNAFVVQIKLNNEFESWAETLKPIFTFNLFCSNRLHVGFSLQKRTKHCSGLLSPDDFRDLIPTMLYNHKLHHTDWKLPTAVIVILLQFTIIEHLLDCSLPRCVLL